MPAEVAQPAALAVDIEHFDRGAQQWRDRPAKRQVADRAGRPPNTRQIDAGQVAVIMRMNGARIASVVGPVAQVARVVGSKPVNDGLQFGS